jgi:hypothetical protein
LIALRKRMPESRILLLAKGRDLRRSS